MLRNFNREIISNKSKELFQLKAVIAEVKMDTTCPIIRGWKIAKSLQLSEKSSPEAASHKEQGRHARHCAGLKMEAMKTSLKMEVTGLRRHLQATAALFLCLAAPQGSEGSCCAGSGSLCARAPARRHQHRSSPSSGGRGDCCVLPAQPQTPNPARRLPPALLSPS